jgi:hypothetical protein
LRSQDLNVLLKKVEKPFGSNHSKLLPQKEKGGDAIDPSSLLKLKTGAE